MRRSRRRWRRWKRRKSRRREAEEVEEEEGGGAWLQLEVYGFYLCQLLKCQFPKYQLQNISYSVLN